MKYLFILLFVLLCTSSFADDSWIFNKSFYSHVDGQRVRQYTAEPAVYGQNDPTYRESGCFDNGYVLQTWGVPYYRHYYYWGFRRF